MYTCIEHIKAFYTHMQKRETEREIDIHKYHSTHKSIIFLFFKYFLFSPTRSDLVIKGWTRNMKGIKFESL